MHQDAKKCRKKQWWTAIFKSACHAFVFTNIKKAFARDCIFWKVVIKSPVSPFTLIYGVPTRSNAQGVRWLAQTTWKKTLLWLKIDKSGSTWNLMFRDFPCHQNYQSASSSIYDDMCSIKRRTVKQGEENSEWDFTEYITDTRFHITCRATPGWFHKSRSVTKCNLDNR